MRACAREAFACARARGEVKEGGTDLEGGSPADLTIVAGIRRVSAVSRDAFAAACLHVQVCGRLALARVALQICVAFLLLAITRGILRLRNSVASVCPKCRVCQFVSVFFCVFLIAHVCACVCE